MIIAITSIIKEGIILSSIVKSNSFPKKDLFETEIQIGKESLESTFKLDIISISRRYQGIFVIFVKNGLLPSFLKKPIEGSIIILVFFIPAFCAIVILSVRIFFVEEDVPFKSL